MLPWDHLAVGYVTFSLLSRLRARPVDDGAFLSAVVGTQFPDLVDKPLAWAVGVLPSGTTLAHSVFVAVPLAVVVYGVARCVGREQAGVGFGVGYLLHLPADVLYGPLTSGGPVEVGALLWPLVHKAGQSATDGFLTTATYYLTRYRTTMVSTEAVGYLLVEVSLLVTAFVLWVADGRPGLPTRRGGGDRW
jgi:hypothetical protein